MTRKRQNRGKRNARNQHRSGQNALLEQMKQLVILERSQQRSLAPQVMDIQKMILPTERLMMFERSITGPVITASTVGPVSGSFRVSLDSVPDYTEFANLFDAYRIVQVTVTFFPIAVMGATGNPTLYTVIDYDDDSNLASIAAASEYPSLQQSVVGAVVERTFSPAAANAAYSGSFTSYARMPKSTWVDMASPGVRYYGLKWILDQSNAATTYWVVTQRVIIQCKNVR